MVVLLFKAIAVFAVAGLLTPALVDAKFFPYIIQFILHVR